MTVYKRVLFEGDNVRSAPLRRGREATDRCTPRPPVLIVTLRLIPFVWQAGKSLSSLGAWHLPHRYCKLCEVIGPSRWRRAAHGILIPGCLEFPLPGTPAAEHDVGAVGRCEPRRYRVWCPAPQAGTLSVSIDSPSQIGYVRHRRHFPIDADRRFFW